MAIVVCQNWQTGAPLSAKLDLPIDFLLTILTNESLNSHSSNFVRYWRKLDDTGQYWPLLDNIGLN